MDFFWQPGMTLEQAERMIIERAFRYYQYNKTHTARALGIAIRTLDNKLDSYAAGMQKEENVAVDAKKG